MVANTTINGAEIGCTCCMSETITVKDRQGNPIKIQIHYDSGSQHSLASRHIHKEVLSKRTSQNPIVLSIVSGDSEKNKATITCQTEQRPQHRGFLCTIHGH